MAEEPEDKLSKADQLRSYLAELEVDELSPVQSGVQEKWAGRLRRSGVVVQKSTDGSGLVAVVGENLIAA